jgi:hypothetical protein
LGGVVAYGQTEGLPAIAREVYRPHTELPPVPAPRVVTERVVTEPPILPPRIVDDTPVVPGAAVTASPAVVTANPVVVTPNPAVIAPAVAMAMATPTILGRYRFGFYNDGNADDNWYYDYYETPKAAAAVVAKPATDAMPGFRTNWTYAPLAERGLFSW